MSNQNGRSVLEIAAERLLPSAIKVRVNNATVTAPVADRLSKAGNVYYKAVSYVPFDGSKAEAKRLLKGLTCGYFPHGGDTEVPMNPAKDGEPWVTQQKQRGDRMVGGNLMTMQTIVAEDLGQLVKVTVSHQAEQKRIKVEVSTMTLRSTSEVGIVDGDFF